MDDHQWMGGNGVFKFERVLKGRRVGALGAIDNSRHRLKLASNIDAARRDAHYFGGDL